MYLQMCSHKYINYFEIDEELIETDEVHLINQPMDYLIHDLSLVNFPC